MKKGLFIVCLSCLLFNCKSKPPDGRLVFAEPVVTDTVLLRGKVFNDSFIMNFSREIEHYKDYLFITASGSDKKLHIFDKNRGEPISSTMAIGKGPGEILEYQKQIPILSTGDCFILEARRKRFTKYDFDSLATGRLVFEDIKYPFDHKVFTTSIFPVNGGLIAYETVSKLVEDEMPPRRFTFAKDDGNIYYYDKYPVSLPDKEENRNIVNKYRDYQKMVFSPDGKRMAVGEAYGGILEIFDLSDSVRLETVKPFYDPGKSETMRGFFDLYATDQFIYTLLIGNGDMEYRNTITVFDWDGNPVKVYKTDINMIAICVDEERGKIYATVEKTEDKVCIIYQFDM